MATNKRRLTEAERDQRRARDRQRLQDACELLLSSDGWLLGLAQLGAAIVASSS